MKVLMVTREYPPFIVGGIATHTFYLVKYLRKMGVDCTIISYGDPRLSTEDTIFIPPSSSVIKLGKTKISEDVKLIKDIYRLTSYVKKHLKEKKYDIVHVQEPYVGGLITYPGRKVTTFHSTGLGEAKTILNSTSYSDSQVLKKLIFDFTLGYSMEYASVLTSEILITPSYTAKHQLIKFYRVNPRKIRVIHNGIEIPKGVLSKEMARHILGLPEDKIVILAIGRHDPRKRYDLLIEAVANMERSLRDQIYVILCGQGSQTHFLKSLVKKYGLDNIVYFTGWVLRENVWLYYSAADVFVSTSDTESAPITLLEAAAVGNAIITTRVGDYALMMENGVHGILIRPGDVTSLVNALEELITNKKLRERLSKKARDFATLFSWERVAMKTIDVYKEVLKGK